MRVPLGVRWLPDKRVAERRVPPEHCNVRMDPKVRVAGNAGAVVFADERRVPNGGEVKAVFRLADRVCGGPRSSVVVAGELCFVMGRDKVHDGAGRELKRGVKHGGSRYADNAWARGEVRGREVLARERHVMHHLRNNL
jgi:hypothetical protein